MRDLGIIVVGTPRSGTSTLARQLATHLSSLGWNVDVDDDDGAYGIASANNGAPLGRIEVKIQRVYKRPPTLPTRAG